MAGCLHRSRAPNACQDCCATRPSLEIRHAFLSSSLSLLASLQYRFQIVLEFVQCGNPLRCGFNDLIFVNEDLASSTLDQWPKAFSHSPTNVAKDLEAIGTRNQEGDAIIAQYTNGFGKAIESLQVKSRDVELLKLSFVHLSLRSKPPESDCQSSICPRP